MSRKIYFLGSGDIAVPVLERLYNSKLIDLIGVCTQKDRPGGRKKNLLPTPVAVWAEGKQMVLDKPDSVNDESFILKLRELSPDIILVVSFGQLLNETFLSIPRLRCINVHASLLPEYRGASPVNAAILNGDRETGITFMEMEKGLDTGAIYKKIIYRMSGKENAQQLEMILGELAGDYVEEVLFDIINDKIVPVKQDNSIATHVGKIKKSDGMINWEMPVEVVEKMIRAYYPWPGGYFFINTGRTRKKITVIESIIRDDLTGKAGEVIRADKKEWVIACGCGKGLEIKTVLPEGKNKMSGADFLRGTRIPEGSVI